MKLKDYQIPQYGLNDGLVQDDLEQYSLKNFDLKAYQRAQQQPQPDPIPAPYDPSLLPHETDRPSPVAAAHEAPPPQQPSVDPWSSTREQPNQPSFGRAQDPVQTVPSQLAVDPCEVQFGAHFNLQTVSYQALSPAESWKIPRWVVMMVGLFFGSAVVLTLVVCVALLRDPRPAPTAQLAAPAAPVATTSVATAQRGSSSPVNEARPDATRAASASEQKTTTAKLMRDDSALPHRIVVSRHSSFVRRQIYRSRRVVAKSTSSPEAAQQTETASRRPAPDALDQLLGESSL